MPTFKLDGREIPFEPGDTVIRAALRCGIEIPHYCWHPGLSVAANCRMCLVEVTSAKPMQMPILRWDEQSKAFVPSVKAKLQPSCQMPAAEGLEVSVSSPEVRKTQAAVQEFLLLNHPVDCPICDQAGECRLQDYWLEHQHTLKRKTSEPVHKPKAVRFGPTIVYDAERCIVCTRCIRFCDEVVGDHVLDVRERGNHNEIVMAQGRELDHRYTLMTEHVCPVGALTSRDFRFKARVWFLKSAPSICPGCATGCNMHADFDPRTQQLVRLRPRDNLEVNRYWMCDDGMMTYKEVHAGRILQPAIGWLEARRPVPQDKALEAAATKLLEWQPAQVGFVLSAQHASEDNYALCRLAEQWGGLRLYLAAKGGWQGDEILRHADNNPNRTGAVRAAMEHHAGSIRDLLRDVEQGVIQAVIVLGSASPLSLQQLEGLRSLSMLLNLTSHDGVWSQLASVVLPVASWAEMDGTYTNAQGREQHFRRAVFPPVPLQPAWQVLGQLAGRLDVQLGLPDLLTVRAMLSKQHEEWSDETKPHAAASPAGSSHDVASPPGPVATLQ